MSESTPHETTDLIAQLETMPRVLTNAINNLYRMPGQVYVQLTETTAQTMRDLFEQAAAALRPRQAREGEKLIQHSIELKAALDRIHTHVWGSTGPDEDPVCVSCFVPNSALGAIEAAALSAGPASPQPQEPDTTVTPVPHYVHEREIAALRQRISWLDGTALPHARKQENANGFQKGWHAALARMQGGESFEVLSALVPEPSSRERVEEIPVDASSSAPASSAAPASETRSAMNDFGRRFTPPSTAAFAMHADWEVRVAHRPSEFTPEGWTLAVFGQHRHGCVAGPSASKRHSACTCGLSEAIHRLNAAPASSLPETAGGEAPGSAVKGEDFWIDELEFQLGKPLTPTGRNYLRTWLRAFAANLKRKAAYSPSAPEAPPLKVGNLRRHGREDVLALLSADLAAEIRAQLDTTLPLLSDDECDRSAAPEAPQGWRDIATLHASQRNDVVFFWIVPKNAAEAYTDTSGRPLVVDHAPYLHKGRYGTWGALSKATHWMPLPLPPASPSTPQE